MDNADFDTAGCLVVSEVKILLEKRERAADNPYVQGHAAGEQQAHGDYLVGFIFSHGAICFPAPESTRRRWTTFPTLLASRLRMRARPSESKEENSPSFLSNFQFKRARRLTPVPSRCAPPSSRALQKDPTLRQFEVAQLANLCPSDADEAKALIPSLGSRDDDALQLLLNELAALRRFQ